MSYARSPRSKTSNGKRTSRFASGYVPLYRALSKLGVASRKAASTAILEGDVQVNGEVITDPTYPVIPESSQIIFRGEPIHAAQTRVILFHKPRKVVTTRHDPEGRTTVYSFFKDELPGFHAVGRLDFNTTGLLLFTNDTQLSNRLLDPASHITRRYLANVRGRVADTDLSAFIHGIADNGELLQAGNVTVVKASNRESTLIIELCSGKNREVRRLCKLLNHEVNRLKRISFGIFQLGDLSPGEHRDATQNELEPYLKSCS